MAMAVTLPALACPQASLHSPKAAVVPLRASRSSKLDWGGCNGSSKKQLRRSVSCSVAPASKQEGMSSELNGARTTVAPFNVLITGSTKGVGLALAEEFLRNGDNVIVCSRSEDKVQDVVQKLRSQFGEQRAWGKACDVRDPKSIQALAEYAKSSIGYVDVWINNAGTNSYQNKSLMDSDDADIMEIVETNTLGVMLCCRQAIKLMKDQQRGGHIFNMDGAGADGNPTPRYAAYGATKRSLAQFTKSLQAELKQSNIQNVVVVHNLSPGMVTTDLLMSGSDTRQPGMVTTDLLMSGSDTRQAKFFINVLAEPAETVAEYLVPRVRKIVGENKNNSTYTRYLTGFKAYTQILARLLFKARKDRFVPED